MLDNPLPVLTSVTPDAVETSDADLPIHLVGSKFINGTIARVGSTDLATTFVSATELDATIPKSFLAVSGSLAISVFNPTPGGGQSASVDLTVSAAPIPNPVPSILGMDPVNTKSGAADLTLKVSTDAAHAFATSGKLKFGSAELTTTVTNGGLAASATVPATLLETSGNIAITFVNPTPGGGTSPAETFSIFGSGTCSNGFADLDGDAANGCETDLSTEPACVTWVHRPDTCLVTRTLERPTFTKILSSVAPNDPVITSSSLGIANVYNAQPDSTEGFFFGGPTVWTATTGTGQINSTTGALSFEGERAEQVLPAGGCPLPLPSSKLYRTKCGGTATIGGLP